ncbi:MAG: hypothetical protein K0Q59_1626 [Paenibacillus sp.]|nr:hypothetical protein [Paenibacillus sp.]
MPQHRRKAFKEQQNHSSIKEEAQTVKANKANSFTPSANGIPKNG